MYVKGDVSGTAGLGTYSSPYSITNAVSKASFYGDTILLLPGAYDGSFFQLNFQGKTIHMKSLNGAFRTYIVTSDAPVFVFNSGESWDTVIEGVSFRNFYNGYMSITAPLISIQNSSPMFKNCLFFYIIQYTDDQPAFISSLSR